MELGFTSRKTAVWTLGGFDVWRTDGMAAAERARWLAELSGALNSARDLLHELHGETKPGIEVQELYVRIEAARLEVQSLRLSRTFTGRTENAPEWTELSLWRPGAREVG